jgi:hypothetical protein
VGALGGELLRSSSRDPGENGDLRCHCWIFPSDRFVCLGPHHHQCSTAQHTTQLKGCLQVSFVPGNPIPALSYAIVRSRTRWLTSLLASFCVSQLGPGAHCYFPFPHEIREIHWGQGMAWHGMAWYGTGMGITA